MADKNEFVVNNDEEILNLISQYVETKGADFNVFPMEDRVKLFLSMVKDCDYQKDSFARVDDFKELFFPKNRVKNLDNYLSTLVVGDKETKENKIVVLYCEQGANNVGNIDKDNTLAFEISFKNHTARKMDIKELRAKVLTDAYQICKGRQNEQEQSQELKTAVVKYLTASNSRQA